MTDCITCYYTMAIKIISLASGILYLSNDIEISHPMDDIFLQKLQHFKKIATFLKNCNILKKLQHFLKIATY